MPIDPQTFFRRLGSAAIFSAIMMLGFLTSAWSFLALFFVVNILCLREFAGIVEKILRVKFPANVKVNFYVSGITLFLAACSLHMSNCENAVSLFLQRYMFYFIGLFIGALLVFLLFSRNRKASYLLPGLGYISLSFALLVHMHFQSLLLPLLLLLFIWMNDTLAYLCGSLFGKTKFFPAISPKKTLEGTLGGFLFTLALAFTWAYFTSWFPLWHWMALALIASVVGTLGDLAESKLKRMAGIKDSGHLMPGHGGALDRFDSLLLATPVAWLFAIIWMHCFPYTVF